jgi:hypothetical protein
MRLLAGIAFLGLAASMSAARATPFDFTYSGGGPLVTFTVPTTDTYQILAFGAQGGSASLSDLFGDFVGVGGRGAQIGGDFGLTAGETLQIAVGGAGSDLQGFGAGGGGGSFVVGPGNTPLVIAGGGGGGATFLAGSLPGGGGLTDPDGGNNGGTDGNGGPGVGSGGGGGGGGFFTAGGTVSGSGGGGAFPDLTGGDVGGGFGGGGGASLGAGGGGGYSGGGGGVRIAGGSTSSGGGGGSFDAGTDQILIADFRTGNGEVLITELAAAVPEPASITILGAGLACLMAVWHRKRRET